MATNPNPTPETKEQREAREQAARAAIQAAIEAGNIVLKTTQRDEKGEITERVSVLVKDKNLEQHYTKQVAKNYEGALAMAGGDDERVWNLFTEAHDLKVRAKIRQQMLAAVEDPEKNYMNAAKALAKLPVYKNRADLKGLDPDALIAAIAAELQAQETEEEEAPADQPTA